MNQAIKFIVLLISILVGLGIGVLAMFFLAPLLAGGVFVWGLIIAGTALVMFIVKLLFGLWLIAGEDEKELTKADKSFSIKQGKDVGK